MREGELDVQVLEEIGEPVPAAGGFHHGLVGSWDAERRVRHALLIDDRAAVVVGCDGGGDARRRHDLFDGERKG